MFFLLEANFNKHVVFEIVILVEKKLSKLCEKLKKQSYIY